MPDATPKPLRKLAHQLYNVPLSHREPDRELQPILDIAEDSAAGRTGGSRLVRAVEQLTGRRHESQGDAGYFEIVRAIDRAGITLRALPRGSLHPPES